MLKNLLLFPFVFSTSAPAQVVTSYRSDNAAVLKGDPNKIVCEKEEKIGTRLGGKKVCMSIADWQARQAADRDQTERIQSGARAPCADDPSCTAPTLGPHP